RTISVVPVRYALSLAVTVPAVPVAVTVAVLPYRLAGAVKLTAAEVYSHISLGSSLPSPFRSPLRYTGEKSSVRSVVVPWSSRSDVIVSGVLLGLVTRYVQTTGAPIASLSGLFESSASSAAVGWSGLAALTAFLTTTPWVVPTWYAGSRAMTVPDGPVARTVAMFRYAPAWTWRVTTPAEVYSQVSPGSSRLLWLASPVLNPPTSTGAGVKSSAVVVGVPLSSRIAVIVSADAPG